MAVMTETLAILGGSKAVRDAEALAQAIRWPLMGAEEEEAVLAAMRDEEVYGVTAKFEEEFAAYHGTRYALAHNNGTSAIHAAFFALGVKPGDEVLVPAYTWHLGVSQALTLHAIPVFCDIDPKTSCISADDIRKKASPHTKAIVALHPFGTVAPMDEIMAAARELGVPVIEDCSHAHGAEYKGRKVGTIGDIGCFSMQASKLLPAIEGGVMITNNREYYERAVVLAHYERIPTLQMPEYRKFIPDYPGAPSCFGFKYRIHPWAAAAARVLLRKLDDQNAMRERNMQYIAKQVADICDGLQFPVRVPDTSPVWFMLVCQYYQEKMAGVSRERFVDALNAEGLCATWGWSGYLPVYANPLYQERNMWDEGCPFDCCHTHRKIDYSAPECPETEAIYKRTIGLQIFPHECDTALLDQYAEGISKVIRNVDRLAI